jgi:hypothetical protein
MDKSTTITIGVAIIFFATVERTIAEFGFSLIVMPLVAIGRCKFEPPRRNPRFYSPRIHSFQFRAPGNRVEAEALTR